MFKILSVLVAVTSSSAFAGQVELAWPQNGVTGFSVLQMGLVGPNEPMVSPIEACLLEAIRHSKELGMETVAEVTCRAPGSPTPSAFYGTMIRK